MQKRMQPCGGMLRTFCREARRGSAVRFPRHCERSEAIQLRAGRRAKENAEIAAVAAAFLFGALRARWIASLRSQ
jgi:hypothetical protein